MISMEVADLNLAELNTSYDTPYVYKLYEIRVNDMAIGDCTVAIEDDISFCERIDIAPQFRNKGYGTATMKLLSEMFDEIVVAPDNESAARLFHNIGREYHEEDATYLEQGYGVFII